MNPGVRRGRRKTRGQEADKEESCLFGVIPITGDFHSVESQRSHRWGRSFGSFERITGTASFRGGTFSSFVDTFFSDVRAFADIS